jgi:hypothetical protein
MRAFCAPRAGSSTMSRTADARCSTEEVWGPDSQRWGLRSGELGGPGAHERSLSPSRRQRPRPLGRRRRP